MLSIIDIIIVLLITVGVVRGAYKGFIKQLSSLGGIILGIIACRLFGDWTSGILSVLIPELKELPFAETTISILGHIVLFIFVYINVALIATMLRGITNKLSLGIFDRVAGALLCVFKYLLALSLLLNLWFLLKPSSSVFGSSRILDGSLLKFIIDLAPWVVNSKFIPASAEIINSITI